MLSTVMANAVWRRGLQVSLSLLFVGSSLAASLPAYSQGSAIRWARAVPGQTQAQHAPKPQLRAGIPHAAPAQTTQDPDHPLFLPLITHGGNAINDNPTDDDASNSAQQGACDAPQQTFGRMFANLPPATWNTADLNLLATQIMATQETDPTPEGQVDDEENQDIDAGYTYAGQFIDHDLTLDDRPNDLTTPIDPQTLKNFRTPKFDLDSVYGAGPTAAPQLYEADGMHLKLGATLTGSSDSHAADLPRDANGQALIGDPRNDENRIVAQLHTIFIRFHNKMVDGVRRNNPRLSSAQIFEQARLLVLRHYQWAVLTDFLPEIVGGQTMQAVVHQNPAPNGPRWQATLHDYNPCMNMPVEFSVAAYRFGHSMVRSLYRLNSSLPDRLPVFANTTNAALDLGGFSPAPSNFAIDWKFFFLMQPNRQVGVPQSSYKMDASLVYPLSLLPFPDAGTGPANLAQRNLLRSVQLGLPTGQDVARALGMRPLPDDQILVGKASGDPDDTVAITSISPAFAGKAPLWVYVLAEATAHAYPVRDGHIVGAQVAPFRLGPVGGQIIAETMVGLLKADPNSILNNAFQPQANLTNNGRFGFREIIRTALTN